MSSTAQQYNLLSAEIKSYNPESEFYLICGESFDSGQKIALSAYVSGEIHGMVVEDQQADSASVWFITEETTKTTLCFTAGFHGMTMDDILSALHTYGKYAVVMGADFVQVVRRVYEGD
jgi:hypothetical protein